MMKRLAILNLVLLFCACSNHNGPLAIFKKLSPHDQYARHLADAGLANTALAREWQDKAHSVLTAPLAIKLPYLETGYFPADKAGATALSFEAKRGQKISILITKKPADLVIYADLFLNSQAETSADSTTLNLEIKTTGTYVLRLQPELLKGGEYTLRITEGPALHFPVAASGHPKIEGFWGDGRDDNSRKHEGIDIFAPHGTPALAADNGMVVNVGENKLGGLVVLMQPEGRDYTLYYAHLGVQLVHNGQQVKSGDTLGLIDNTGNAKNTPSHLHFGIYTGGKAIDPLLFVKPANEIPAPVTAPLAKLNTLCRYKDMPVTVVAAAKNQYRVILPDQETSFVPAADVRSLDNRQATLKLSQSLYDRPDTTAARITQLEPNSKVTIKGTFKKYKLVDYRGAVGWVLQDGKL